MKETTGEFELDTGQIVEAIIRYYPGRDGVHTLPNGDPGYPSEDAEVEVFDPTLYGEPYDASEVEIEEWEKLVLENPQSYFIGPEDAP